MGTRWRLTRYLVAVLLVVMVLGGQASASPAEQPVTSIPSSFTASSPLSWPAWGMAWSWGNNWWWQLDDGTEVTRWTPVKTLDFTNVAAVEGGAYFTVARYADGSIWAVGQNGAGQLGDGTTTDRWSAVRVKGPGGVGYLGDVKAIAAGYAFALALKTDGTVWAWGANPVGQLGNGTTTDSATPVQVLDPSDPSGYLTDIVAIAAGVEHGLALKTDGTVRAWGRNWYGALGDNTTTTRTTPIQVLRSDGSGGAVPLTGVAAVKAGWLHSLAIKTDGTVWGWGGNGSGQLGLGYTSIFGVKIANQTVDLSGVTAIEAGRQQSLALRSDGTVWAFGQNGSGELGDGTTVGKSTPVQVKGPGGTGFLAEVRAVATNSYASHSLALKQNGTVWTWGLNNNGQLGDGTNGDKTTPIQVKGPGGSGYLGGVSAISAGYLHSLAVGNQLLVEGWAQATELLESLQGTSRDPVITSAGTYVYSRTDLALSGRGPSPAFSRSYSSADTVVGPLGPGWTHSYHSRIVRDESGRIAVVSPGGRRDVYTPLGGGEYASPQGVSSELSQDPATAEYVLTHPDQSAWVYSVQGRLLRISDRHGSQSTLSYNPSGQLVSVSDPAGRGNLTLAYDPTSGRLTSVSDWLSPARSVQYQYDGEGRLWKVVDREGQTTTYGYDGTTSRLTTIADARGNVAVTNTYDAEGRVASQKDARGLVTGEQTTFAYVTNPDGTKTTTVTYPATSLDPNWHPTVVDSYDLQGRIVRRVSKPSANPADDVVEEYAYDANSFRTSVRDGRGNTTHFCYDVDYSGQPIPGSRGNLTRRIDPPPSPGASRPVTLYQYDAKHNLIQTIPPKGVASGTTVDCATSLSASLNALYATDLAYDQASQTRLESTTRRYTDPELGQRTAVTKYEYTDPSNPGLVTKVIPPRGNALSDDGYATTFAYFGPGPKAGLLESVTDPLGNKSSYDYDAVGRRTAMVDPNGHVQGALPAEHTWEYVYDQEDRLRFSKAPPPQSGGSQPVTEYRYDPVGNRSVVVDPNGQVTRYLYDERDSLREVWESPSVWTDPTLEPSPKIVTEYAYDHLGNLSRVTRAKGDGSYERAVDYAYDGLNRLRKETQYPAWPTLSPTLVTEHTYDPNGNRLTLKDPLDQTTTFGYDALSRLVSVAYSDGVTPSVSYAYDPHGNRASMTDGTGTTSYAYDELDRLLSVTSPGPKVVGYRYDLDGNRTKVLYPDGTAVAYTFDRGSRLESLQDWASRTTSYQYFPDGALKLTTYPNGTSADYTYDHARRLLDVWSKQGSSTINRHTYALDAAGNRTQVDELRPQLGPPGQVTPALIQYGYDRLYRLTSVSSSRGPVTYAYDPVGNRLSKVGDGAVTSYSYDAADRLQESVTRQARISASDVNALRTEVDALRAANSLPAHIWAQPTGDVSSANVVSAATFDEVRLALVGLPGFGTAPQFTAGPVTSSRTAKLGDLIDLETWIYGEPRVTPQVITQQISYNVNANGNLVARGADTLTYDQANRLKSVTIGGATSSYGYDGDGKRSTKTVGGVTISYVYDVNAALPVLLDDGERKYVWGLGLAYAVDSAGSVQVYHTDGLGSVRAITDATGSVIQTYESDEFGVQTASQGSLSQPFGYTGEQRDAESGLVYLRARTYDPQIGRFLSRDTLFGNKSSPGSLNRFAYALNNPLSFVDPSGHCPVDVDWGAVNAMCAAEGMDCSSLTPDMAAELLYGNGRLFDWEDPYALTGGSPVDRVAFVAANVGPRGAKKAAFGSFSALKNRLGKVGPDYAWHHIVEQTPTNVARFGREVIHGVDNVVKVRAEINNKIAAYYSSKQYFSEGLRVREWLASQSFEAQWEFGLRILREMGDTTP